MVREILVGCCGFPVKRERYFEVLRGVELQNTFYRLVKEESLKKLRESAPGAFISIKAPMGITHRWPSPVYRRAGYGKDSSYLSQLGAFRETEAVRSLTETLIKWLEAAGARAVLFQTPASFKQTEENLSQAVEYFRRFRERLRERGLKVIVAWEPRGWTPLFWDLLDALGVVLAGDPEEIGYPPGDVAYLRLHGRVAGRGYGREYFEEEIRRIIENLYSFQRAYIFFNNVRMFNDAQKALKVLEEMGLQA